MIKRLSLIILALIFMSGCAHIGFKNEQANEILIKVAAKVFAYKFLQKNPSYREPVKFYCKAIQEGNINQAIIDVAVQYLNDKAADDPLLKSSLADLSGLIVIDMSDPAFNLELVKIAATGFMEGIELLEQVK